MFDPSEELGRKFASYCPKCFADFFSTDKTTVCRSCGVRTRPGKAKELRVTATNWHKGSFPRPSIPFVLYRMMAACGAKDCQQLSDALLIDNSHGLLCEWVRKRKIPISYIKEAASAAQIPVYDLVAFDGEPELSRLARIERNSVLCQKSPDFEGRAFTSPGEDLFLLRAKNALAYLQKKDPDAFDDLFNEILVRFTQTLEAEAGVRVLSL